ncbi:S9 family peptidase [Streptomyces sp. NPDC046925]|uniref:S9 family peptidase n=1 Tax=Streptomyces sp. NPDC046925 TaxID=3155375 RepID=UPI0033E44A42
MHDIRNTAAYTRVAEHFDRLHTPALGRPHAVMDPQISPDASRVLVTGSVFDALEGQPRTRLFSARDGRLVAVCADEGSSSHGGRFSPDGKTLAFLSDRAKKGVFQLFLAETAGTDDAIAAPAVDGTVEYVCWSPDSRRVLLGVAGFGADLAGGQGSGANVSVESELPAWHPNVEQGVPDSAWRSLWMHDLRTGELTQVSPDGVNCWEAAWCGLDRILAITSDSPGEDSWYDAALAVIDPASRSHRPILTGDNGAQLGFPAGSHDGRYAAVVQAVCSDRQVIAGDLLVIDVATGTRTPVATDGVDVTAVQWISGHVLGYAGLRGLESVYGRYDHPDRRGEEVYAVPLSGGPMYPQASFAETGEIAAVLSGYRLPHEVVVVAGGEPDVRASVSHAGSDYLLSVCGTAEHMSWHAPDGLEIQGILCLPEGEGPFPLVINIHGGPVWAFQDSWSMKYPWVPLLVSRGYAVLSPNPRGSGGRGQEFVRHVVGDMGGKDSVDIISGVDTLVQRGVVDPLRVGLIGGSYGGFMSSWLVTQDRRFAAAVPISPVTDWYSQSFTSNIAAWGNSFLRADPEVPGTAAHTRSPVLQAGKARTPCLNIAGAKDRCTPPGQALEFHRALTAKGVESVLAVYPEEGHGVRAFPAVTDFLTRAMTWFDRHMPAGGET